MTIRDSIVIASIVAALGLCSWSFARPSALETAFTYQGRIKNGGAPVTGTVHLRFQMFDALTGGSQVGSDFNSPATTVSDGLFTAALDFGAIVFNGEARWLQVQIITNGGATVTTFVPRQPITATPYALQTRGVFVDSANKVGIGTSTPQVALHLIAPNTGTTPGEGIRIQGTQSTGANLSYLSFANGAGTAIGYVGDGGGSENNIYLGAYGADIGLVNSTFGTALIAKASGRIGIGTTSPGHKLHVVSTDSTTPGLAAIRGEGASFYGVLGVNTNIGIGVRGEGWSVGVSGTSASTLGKGVEGIGNTGVEGRSTASTGFDFNAIGPGVNYGATSSRRWKHNVERIGDPLDMIGQLRGVYFDWDAKHGGHRDIGMIAEEVGQVLPEIVVYEENGIDAIGMDYSKLTPLLVEAIKALRTEKDAEITDLRDEKNAEIAQLNSRVAALEELVHNLLAERRSQAPRSGNAPQGQ